MNLSIHADISISCVTNDNLLSAKWNVIFSLGPLCKFVKILPC